MSSPIVFQPVVYPLPGIPSGAIVETIIAVPELKDIWMNVLPLYLYYPCPHCDKVTVTGYSYCCHHCMQHGTAQCSPSGECGACSYKKDSEGWRTVKRKMYESHRGRVLINIIEDKPEAYSSDPTSPLPWAKRVKVCDGEKCNRC